MTHTHARWSALALATALAACGGPKDGAKEAPAAGAPAAGSGKVEETGKDPAKNPLQALEQMGKAAQKASEDMKNAAARPPVEPVKFDVLLPFLPKPSGWKPSEPQGSTTAMGEWKVTVVNASYTKEGDDATTAHVEITDGSYVPLAYMPFKMASQFSQESTEGYQKGITLDGNPGFESWKKADKRSELSVLIGDRFIVRMDANGVEPAVLRQWLEAMKLKDLAGLAGPR